MKGKRKKILIADSEPALFRKLKQNKQYQFDHAASGFDCWEKIESFDPDLIVIDLMLPQIHGMEILRKIKTNPRTQHIGVILISYCPSSQNYHSALINHVDYFLEKPVESSQLLSLFRLYFKSQLHPKPFTSNLKTHDGHYYCPKTKDRKSVV